MCFQESGSAVLRKDSRGTGKTSWEVIASVPLALERAGEAHRAAVCSWAGRAWHVRLGDTHVDVTGLAPWGSGHAQLCSGPCQKWQGCRSASSSIPSAQAACRMEWCVNDLPAPASCVLGNAGEAGDSVKAKVCFGRFANVSIFL